MTDFGARDRRPGATERGRGANLGEAAGPLPGAGSFLSCRSVVRGSDQRVDLLRLLEAPDGRLLTTWGISRPTPRPTGASGWRRAPTRASPWSEPAPKKARPTPDGWIGWTNNSVHGIQLTGGPRKGRLVIPGFLYKDGEEGQIPGVRGGVLYSDDHGSTWQVGGVLPVGSDEVTVVETAEGGVYANYRKNRPFHNDWRWHAVEPGRRGELRASGDSVAPTSPPPSATLG